MLPSWALRDAGAGMSPEDVLQPDVAGGNQDA